jgi:hypothetical protein
MDFPWGHQRRFNSYPDYMRKLFGGRVQKLPLMPGSHVPIATEQKELAAAPFV